MRKNDDILREMTVEVLIILAFMLLVLLAIAGAEFLEL